MYHLFQSHTKKKMRIRTRANKSIKVTAEYINQSLNSMPWLDSHNQFQYIHAWTLKYICKTLELKSAWTVCACVFFEMLLPLLGMAYVTSIKKLFFKLLFFSFFFFFGCHSVFDTLLLLFQRTLHTQIVSDTHKSGFGNEQKSHCVICE